MSLAGDHRPADARPERSPDPSPAPLRSPAPAPQRIHFRVVGASTRRRILSALAIAAIVTGLLVLARVDPSGTPFLPRCPSKFLLGLECPGCGSTRATHHLLQGDVATAMRFNPALVLFGAPLALAWIALLAHTVVSGRRIVCDLGANGGRIGWMIAAALVVYVIARNLPLEALEWLRPPPPPSPATSPGP